MSRAPRQDSSGDPSAIRFLGVCTAGCLVLLLGAIYLLPKTSLAAALLGALGLLGAIAAGTQFLYHAATLISKALDGRRRAWFQIAVALATPVTIGLILISRVDAVPMTTLWEMLEPWLLLPLAIIAWVCWHVGRQIVGDDHPFQFFLIVAAALGAWCFLRSMGMFADSYGPDSEAAKRARQTGEYVWSFALYVTTAYLVLLLRLKMGSTRRELQRDVRDLDEKLTPDIVNHIITKMGQYVADRQGRHGPGSDLPFPRALIELAYMKALRDTPEGPELEALKTFYSILDDYMLSDADADVMKRWHGFVLSDHPANPLRYNDTALVRAVLDAGCQRAGEISTELLRKSSERAQTSKILRVQ
jgi:hypothetical protein